MRQSDLSIVGGTILSGIFPVLTPTIQGGKFRDRPAGCRSQRMAGCDFSWQNEHPIPVSQRNSDALELEPGLDIEGAGFGRAQHVELNALAGRKTTDIIVLVESVFQIGRE